MNSKGVKEFRKNYLTNVPSEKNTIFELSIDNHSGQRRGK